MKSKLIFSLLLILSSQTLLAETKYVHKFITLEHWALKLVDGKSPGMNGDACLDTLQVRGLINKMLKGQPDKATKTFIKIYEVDGKKVALDDLVELEKSEKLIKDSKAWKEFHEVLQTIKDQFLEFTAPLLGEAEIARKTTMNLVIEWCGKSNRNDSLLLNWGAANEREVLNAATAREFRRFTRDLKNFLHDLMFNCPKGREAFKKERLSMLVLRETFTKLANKPGTFFEKAFETVSEQKAKEENDGCSKEMLATYIDRQKKHKLTDGQLINAIFEALELADDLVSKEEFEELFYKLYKNKCDNFDLSFTDTE